MVTAATDGASIPDARGMCPLAAIGTAEVELEAILKFTIFGYKGAETRVPVRDDRAIMEGGRVGASIGEFIGATAV